MIGVLRANNPGLDTVLAAHDLHIFSGRTSLSISDLELPNGSSEIVIYLASARSKKGVFQSIVGITLIALSFLPIPGAQVLFVVGSMMLSYGMSQMFQPRLPITESDTNTSKESDVFTGGQNIAPMGAAVPLVLGKCWASDVVVGASINVTRG